jgi:hypothetical protein
MFEPGSGGVWMRLFGFPARRHLSPNSRTGALKAALTSGYADHTWPFDDDPSSAASVIGSDQNTLAGRSRGKSNTEI